MSKVIPLAFAALFAAQVQSAPLEYYLPGGASYDATVPEPAVVIGHEIGEWHITHDRLVAYMRALAEASPRVAWYESGKTHEGRPLLLLAMSSPANLARLEDIRAEHLAWGDPRRKAGDPAAMPAVVWMGYSVHGDEPSGSNAAPVVAYHLAAAEDEWTRRLLDETVILFDPSVNPDGLQRFSTWANSHRGHTLVADPQSREHNQGWPSGRTNHYWFDLNRDWLLLVHPESRARVREFHRWRPNVLTDFHEMGTDRTYFFQPGVPSRQNPLFPQRTFDLTMDIARYHAEALDRDGRLYYSREGFDDFYLGKGSTYPDIHGGIGILFEQASSRGHLQESVNGELSFPFTIRNQVTTSFSTLRAVLDKRVELLRWQRSFYESALEDSRRADAGDWVFGDAGDPARTRRFIEVLLAHDIVVHPLARAISIDDERYEPGRAWVVPAAQPQYRLARAIFETRTEFADTTFYDVSTWTLPHAFALPYSTAGRRLSDRWLGERIDAVPGYGETPVPADAYAYAFQWNGYFAPRTAYRLLDAGVRVRVATESFEVRTANGVRVFDRGAIVVPMGIQDDGVRERVRSILAEAVARDGTEVHAITSGLSTGGVDLGSPSLEPVELPRVALVVGQGVSQYEAGATWHLLDRRFGMPVTLLDVSGLDDADLDRYTHLVMVDGRYGRLDDDVAARIKAWVRGGGVLYAAKRAMRWTVEADIVAAEFIEGGKPQPGSGRRDYADAKADRELQMLSGAILETDLDVTHPLGWGMARRTLPVFRNSELYLAPPADPYATVARYTDRPLLSGYVSDANLEQVAGTASVVVLRSGAGAVVLAADDLNFRGYWYGTNRLFMNAVFFGGLVERTEVD